MRCPECNKFVAYDTDVDPEVDIRVEDDGMVDGSVTITNNCEGCGCELKSAEFEVAIDFSEAVAKHKAICPDQALRHSFDVEFDCSREDRTQRTDRHGRPIKSSRYMRTYYGARASVELSCSCGESVDGGTADWADECQASSMKELV